MNELQQFIVNFAESKDMEDQINSVLYKRLEAIEANPEWTLRILHMLDTRKSSLMKLWLNCALIQNARRNKKLEFDHVQKNMADFFQNFELNQISSAYSKLSFLCQNYADYLISVEKPIFGILPLKIGIRRTQYNSEMVTPLHREFCKLCLKAKCYPQSLDIIRQPATSFKKGTSTMDIIVYTYYRGLLFTGLKSYQEAIESFKLCLSLPTTICHKVHQESYKKLMLLSLIETKSNPSLAQYVTPLLRMKLDHSTHIYQQLSNCFLTKDEAGFNICLEEGKFDFKKDKNVGLVKKLKKEFQNKRICDLSYTYLTLNYKEILNRVQTKDQKEQRNEKWLETTLFQMIKAGQIKAKIDSEKQMISFIDTQSTNVDKDDAKEGEYIEVIQQLENQNERIVELMKKMENMDKNIKQSVAYQQKMLLGKAGARGDQEDRGDFHSFA